MVLVFPRFICKPEFFTGVGYGFLVVNQILRLPHPIRNWFAHES